jgi:hypothetical protein
MIRCCSLLVENAMKYFVYMFVLRIGAVPAAHGVGD